MKKKLSKKFKNLFNKALTFTKKYWFLLIIAVIALIVIKISIHNYLYKPYAVDKDFSKVDLGASTKLMIVAHPDDEILWGGAHLIEDNYLVVCITCGPVKERVNEFIKVMGETNDKYIMLGYPDKTNGERDTWDDHRENIANDIKEILNLRDWETIVTHNPDGEYGHQHHIMTNRIVTSVVEEKDKLYYFGRYHSKIKIPEYYSEMMPINDIYYKEKQRIIGLYKSQYFIQTMFDHMFYYEDFVAYDDWGVIDEEL